jgi:hypothetical protein
MRLDEEKLEALRTWGDRLRKSAGEESAAVGRAILMLVEEIDRLHIDLWHAQMERVSADATREDEEQPVASSLHERLHRVLRRTPGPAEDVAEESGSGTETDMSSSPQAWIAAMRRKT